MRKRVFGNMIEFKNNIRGTIGINIDLLKTMVMSDGVERGRRARPSWGGVGTQSVKMFHTVILSN